MADYGTPLAVWECNPGPMPLYMERCAWAIPRIPHCNWTHRLEFYLIDTPFCVAYRTAHHENGTIILDPVTFSPLDEPPAVVLLSDLPPEELLYA